MTTAERVIESMQGQVIGDAEASTYGNHYAAVLRDRVSWNVITNCPHQHRTRESAERCADGWLRKEYGA